jgi:heat shock protein HslJ
MIRSLTAILALTMVGTACSSAPPLSLDGRELLLTSWTANGQPVSLLAGTQVRLSFADGNLGAYAGCNHLGGDYALSQGRLVVQALSMTEMGCDALRHQQDERVAALLSSGPTARMEGDQLILDGSEGVAIFRDRRAVEPDLPLVGRAWTLVTLIEGDAAMSVPGNVTARIQFAEDGTVNVEPGCNTGSGRYELGERLISFGPIALTRMACPGDRDRVERAVLEVLSGEAEYEVHGATLTLRSGERGLQLSGR